MGTDPRCKQYGKVIPECRLQAKLQEASTENAAERSTDSHATTLPPTPVRKIPQDKPSITPRRVHETEALRQGGGGGGEGGGGARTGGSSKVGQQQQAGHGDENHWSHTRPHRHTTRLDSGVAPAPRRSILHSVKRA
ncbi:hypothetical protein E2C01_019314 [Portunus trituberculatus]|uniref:Uncharacterized protein n=1 Tax=Portunus trituberculatus TaxID=210409 RepID=A0A5B7DWW7_PORTR|nr:hypothetical protein [Portunus trituberculatus]